MVYNRECFGAMRESGGDEGSEASVGEKLPQESWTQTLWPQFYSFLFLPRTNESQSGKANFSKALEAFIKPEKAQDPPYNGGLLVSMLLAICYA